MRCGHQQDGFHAVVARQRVACFSDRTTDRRLFAGFEMRMNRSVAAQWNNRDTAFNCGVDKRPCFSLHKSINFFFYIQSL